MTTAASPMSDMSLTELSEKNEGFKETDNTTAPETKIKVKKTLEPRITTFVGEYMNPVKRRISRTDAAKKGAFLVTNRTLEGPSQLVIQKVVGFGKFTNTGEEYITVEGQYAPGKTCRLTASAQNKKLMVDAILHGNVDQSSGISNQGQVSWPLYHEVTVDAYGTKMRGYALLVEELFLHGPEGTTVIIGAPEATEMQQAAESLF